MPVTKPSLDLLRSLTDEYVLRALMAEHRLTRAGLATVTGLSKPTVSESVRRLTDGGVLADTGERTTGRGRVGSYYALADDIGCAVVVSVAPEAIVAEAIDVHGCVTGRTELVVERPARPAHVARSVQTCVRRALRAAGSPARLAVVSAADPVDRTTGRLVHLPDAPFLLGELSPVHILSRLVDGPVVVDNDVNWAAQAERAASPAGTMDDIAYVHLGEGLGCAIINDGTVRRGHSGLVGEIAHIVTMGPKGRPVPFTEMFAALGLRRPGSTAIDVDRLLSEVDRGGAAAQRTSSQLAQGICGILAAVVALADPSLVVIGGTWGRHPVILEAVAVELARHPRHTQVRAAAVTVEPSLVGARYAALERLRTSVVARATATRKPLASAGSARSTRRDLPRRP